MGETCWRCNTPLPDPTPKLTAENVAQAIHDAHDAMIRRKAFDEAAERAEATGHRIPCASSRNRAVARALWDFAEDLRAFAKEQG